MTFEQRRKLALSIAIQIVHCIKWSLFIGSKGPSINDKPNAFDAAQLNYQPPNIFLGRQEIEQLMEFQPQGIPQHERKSLVDFYVDSKGKQRVKGNAQLKLSQAYARAFHG